VFLVVSMMASMLLTRVAKDGLLIPCFRIKTTTTTTKTSSSKHSGEDRDVEEQAADEGENN